MAHVLLGWEFGANRGHAARLDEIAARLRRDGHRTTFAVQRLNAIDPADAADGAVLQAPLSPRLLKESAGHWPGMPATLGDILARLGLDDPAIVAGMVAAWRRILAAERPDAVIADYAPLLLRAAQGEAATVAVGTGFDLPPVTLDRFPSLTGGPPLVPEERVLERCNRGLAAAGVPALGALPQLFAADRAVVGTFAELDPYRGAPGRDHAAPPLGNGLPPVADGSGDEVFVYLPARLGGEGPLWDGLARIGCPIRAFLPLLPEDRRAALAAKGIRVETAPLPWERIAASARLILSHGGHGTVCAALAAGIPQVILPLDLEKALVANAVAGMGLGGQVSPAAIRPEPFAQSLQRLFADEAIAARARAAAADFRVRCGESHVDRVAREVESLL